MAASSDPNFVRNLLRGALVGAIIGLIIGALARAIVGSGSLLIYEIVAGLAGRGARRRSSGRSTAAPSRSPAATGERRVHPHEGYRRTATTVMLDVMLPLTCLDDVRSSARLGAPDCVPSDVATGSASLRSFGGRLTQGRDEDEPDTAANSRSTPRHATAAVRRLSR